MDDKKRTARYWMAFLILAVFLMILFVWNVNAGSIHLSVSEILNIIFRHQGDATAYNIIWEIRLPRILSVIILGGALSVSGFLLQTFFNNPIAGPFVLGISSGAKLVVALLMIYFLSRSISMGSAAMIIAAFIGSMISMGFVLLVAKKVHNMSMLVISGVMIGYICSAVTDFVVTFADDSNIVNLHNWSLGSFSGMSWGNVKVMAIVVLLTMVIVFFMSKPIGAYQLGEVYAQNMGVNIKLFRIGLILLSSILSACVTAFAGPISFVGIAVPHIVKSLLKTARPLLVIPACFLGGAVFCLFCDLIARTVFVAAVLGPFYGMLPNLLSGLLMGMTVDIYSLYYAPVGILLGFVTGLVYRKFQPKKWQIFPAALVITLPSTIISSCITAFLFGGITSSGSTVLVQLLAKTPLGMVGSCFVVQFITDYIDRVLCIAVAAVLITALRKSMKENFA